MTGPANGRRRLILDSLGISLRNLLLRLVLGVGLAAVARALSVR